MQMIGGFKDLKKAFWFELGFLIHRLLESGRNNMAKSHFWSPKCYCQDYYPESREPEDEISF